jgi:LysM repeat protein
MKTRTLLFGILTLAATSFAGAATHVVKSGDNLYRIALNYGVTLNQLQQANPGVHAQSLRIGQKLTIPGRSGATAATTAPVAKAATTPRAASSGTYEVKAGDSLSKIARLQGTSVAALQAANPQLNPNKMAIGQKINLPGASSTSRPASADIARSSTPAPAPVKKDPVVEPSPTPEPAPMPEIPAVAETPAPVKESTPAPALTDSSTQTVKNQTKEGSEPAPAAYRLIKTTRELTLEEVAKEYKTTPEKINSLNGWNFSPQTLLAVDSELYIPAQP